MIKDTSESQLYFAYGSNMDTMQMDCRCPKAERLGTATLKDFQLQLDSAGLLTIEPCEEMHVEGLLWLLAEGNEDALDRYEGVALGCYRKEYVTVSIGERQTEALVYISERGTHDGRTYRPGYLDMVLDAAQREGLSMRTIVQLNMLAGYGGFERGVPIIPFKDEKLCASIERLRRHIKQERFGRRERIWGGADVVILPDSKNDGTQYSDYTVFTPYWKELGWTMSRVAKIFREHDSYSYEMKYILFRRLAGAANSVQQCGHISRVEQCLAVVDEALLIAQGG